MIRTLIFEFVEWILARATLEISLYLDENKFSISTYVVGASLQCLDNGWDAKHTMVPHFSC